MGSEHALFGLDPKRLCNCIGCRSSGTNGRVKFLVLKVLANAVLTPTVAGSVVVVDYVAAVGHPKSFAVGSCKKGCVQGCCIDRSGCCSASGSAKMLGLCCSVLQCVAVSCSEL